MALSDLLESRSAFAGSSVLEEKNRAVSPRMHVANRIVVKTKKVGLCMD
jgi:hypothetical protein